MADFDSIDIFVEPLVASLAELGISVSPQACLEEVDRFVPLSEADVRSVVAASYLFLSHVRFLHRASLRRRCLVTPDLALPRVGIVFTHADADAADTMVQFLTRHDVTMIDEPEDVPDTARLVVLLSRASIESQDFWSRLTAWRRQPATPMVVCLIPKAELYRDAPAGVPDELWVWLGDNAAVELGSGTEKYNVLLHALDSHIRRQWWWHDSDAVEIGLAVDVLGVVEGLPRPPIRRSADVNPTGRYPAAPDGMLLAACVLASERLTRGGAPTATPDTLQLAPTAYYVD